MRRGLIAAAFLLIMTAFSGMAEASHYRFGHITWTRAPGSRVVTFTITSGWRTDNATFPNTVLGDSLNAINFGDGTPNYASGCVNLPGGCQIIGTGTDGGGSPFTIRRYTIQHTFPHDGPFLVAAQGNARISSLVNAADQPYRVETVVDLRTPTNTGSPVSSVPVILQFAKGAAGSPQLYALPIADPNGQPFTCRLATVSESRIPTQPIAGSKPLSVSSNCILSWDTSGTTAGQKYATGVIIQTSGADITRVALDFVIEIQNTVSSSPPSCAGFSGTHTMAPGQTFSTSFTGTDPDGGAVLKIGTTGLPGAATLSPAAGSTGASPLTTTFSWTPTQADVGSHSVNVTFTDAFNLSTQCGFSIQVTNPDADGDGHDDVVDNCPAVPNPDQTNTDGLPDGGDACDSDDDEDGDLDVDDNCPLKINGDQSNNDGDLDGDACDADDDNDGVIDPTDNCVFDSNGDQANNDGDGAGDICDLDDDNDGVPDAGDNCPFAGNPTQADSDADGQGDVCDGDDDNDGKLDAVDNCPFNANPLQEDLDGDTFGDACDADDDGDGVDDVFDNCATVANGNQFDNDGDNLGDVCDIDDDNDGVFDATDNCGFVQNADQADNDNDAAGDACDADDDNDTVNDGSDNCHFAANTDQANNDADTEGDVCDADDDNDTVNDTADNCAFKPNADQANTDGDSEGDACDLDLDGDGVANVLDNCVATANASQADLDGDGTGDACDNDVDGDGVLNGLDNCELVSNASQSDLDGDGAGDACDPDIDNDGVVNGTDNCVVTPNADQANNDSDSQGDVCDDDDDNDSVLDGGDNCQFVANASQSNFDGDAFGDACDNDDDNDNVGDGTDQCPNTTANTPVDPSTGCSVPQLCPCSGPRGQSIKWKNHGAYASCIAHSTNSLIGAGVLTQAQKDAYQTAASQSNCGK